MLLTVFSLLELFFSCGGERNPIQNTGHCFAGNFSNYQIFKFFCDIQGSHLIGYLWVSLIIHQLECLVCYFFCTELTLFCTEFPENCIYLNQSELSIFSCILLVFKKINSCLFTPNCTRNHVITPIAWLSKENKFIISSACYSLRRKLPVVFNFFGEVNYLVSERLWL